MKIHDSHYQEIVKGLSAIKGWLELASPQYQAAGHSPQRFMWDGFRVAKVHGNTTRWICDELYNYLNDEHINTALRSAYTEIGVLQKDGQEVCWVQKNKADISSHSEPDDRQSEDVTAASRFGN